MGEPLWLNSVDVRILNGICENLAYLQVCWTAYVLTNTNTLFWIVYLIFVELFLCVNLNYPSIHITLYHRPVSAFIISPNTNNTLGKQYIHLATSTFYMINHEWQYVCVWSLQSFSSNMSQIHDFTTSLDFLNARMVLYTKQNWFRITLTEICSNSKFIFQPCILYNQGSQNLP